MIILVYNPSRNAKKICSKKSGLGVETLPSLRLTFFLLCLLARPSLSCHECACDLCGGFLEVYRGERLLLSTMTTRTETRNITRGADQVLANKISS